MAERNENENPPSGEWWEIFSALCARLSRPKLLLSPALVQPLEPSEDQLKAFVGMGYADDATFRHAFALSQGSFEGTIELIERWRAPIRLTLTERGESEDTVVHIDLPSLKNKGDAFVGTDESCDGQFLLNEFANRFHARCRLGPAPPGTCELQREGTDYRVHIADNRSKYGLFVNTVRVRRCANLQSGDVVVLGWKAAARTRSGKAFTALPFRSDIQLAVSIGPAAICTECAATAWPHTALLLLATLNPCRVSFGQGAARPAHGNPCREPQGGSGAARQAADGHTARPRWGASSAGALYGGLADQVRRGRGCAHSGGTAPRGVPCEAARHTRRARSERVAARPATDASGAA